MTDDIVVRLRRDCMSLIADEAAAYIERLRAERDEARRSCCEYAAIVDGADTTEGMESGRFYEIAMKYMKDRGWDCFKESDETVRNDDEFRETLTELQQRVETLTAERDEARQMFCNAMTDHCEEDEARQIAKEQGWDCFKEDKP
jgi:hypothetical protein